MSNRLAYTAGVLLGKGNFKITENKTDFENYDGPKINYSVEFNDNSLQILPDGLLYETGIKNKPLNIEVTFEYGLPEFCNISTDGNTTFENSKPNKYYKLFLEKQKDFFQNNIIGFDIFSAVFYIISRYEEYGDYIPDTYSRFCGKDSMMFKNNLHTKPLVDIWRQTLYNKLKEIFPMVQLPEVKYTILATIDIDRLYLYKEKGLIKSLGGIAKDILNGKFAEVSKRLKVLTGKDSDPHDNLSTIIDYYKKQNIELKVFWLLGDKSKYDNNLPFDHEYQKSIIQKVSEYAEVGIHPSYNSYNNITQIKFEKQKLETILGKPVTASRQHFLRLKLPQTYKQLLQAGITHDYTMGWHDIIGFRAGTAHTFNWYDIENETETILQITPFVAMDVTLKNYMNLNIEQASIVIADLQNEIKKYGGTFVTIAHNESLSGWGEWRNWDAYLK